MSSVIAIIQARLGSTRLPNKVLMQIPPESGVSMLEMVVRKVLLATMVDDVAVVTPDLKIGQLCEVWNVAYFVTANKERDVLKEYYDAATELKADVKADVIVRITSDCPLIRTEIIDKCVDCFIKLQDVSLVYNTDESTGQLGGEGSDVEVFSYDALKQAYHNAKDEEREHPTLWIRRNMGKILFIPNAQLGIRSVNDRKDYEFVCNFVNGGLCRF